MKAFVVSAPLTSGVEDVLEPKAGPGQVVVDVTRVGVCGTDVEFFTGEMAYLHSGHEKYPLRLGHEWCGVISEVGDGVDKKHLGKRVTGDTMLGCGNCYRCKNSRQHVCENRFEIGIRNGWAGALAEKLLVPFSAIHFLPDSINDTVGALIEPGGNSLRAAEAALSGPGKKVLVWGSGTIGLLTAQFASFMGAYVHVIGRNPQTLSLAKQMGASSTSNDFEVIEEGFDAVIDCTFDKDVPNKAVKYVEPGGRVVYIGISGVPSLIDSRDLVLKDVTAVGILSASPGLEGTIHTYASGKIDPSLIVAATVGLSETSNVLAGKRPTGAGIGPKIHIDPRKD